MIAHAFDGEPLPFRVVGASGRTPILTAHGLVSSVEHWRFFTPHFARERPVVSWDYRGHGGQPAPRDHASASVAAFADDAHAVWQQAALGPAIAAGLSFGVQVALELWRRHPDAVRALILICGTAGHPLDRVSSSPALRRGATRLVRALGARRALAAPLLAPLRTKLGRKLACEIAYAAGGARRDSTPPEVLDELFGHASGIAPRVLAEVTASYLEHTAFDILPTITVPTLIVAGDRDELTPVSTSERMQRAIPGSELAVFAGCSHLCQVEQPVELHRTIERFLAKHAL